jgi:hypothetical protein
MTLNLNKYVACNFNNMRWSIQHAFHMDDPYPRFLTSEQVHVQVDATADLIRDLGYIVTCGTWQDDGNLEDVITLCDGEEFPVPQEDTLIPDNYAIVSISKPCGENVYGYSDDEELDSTWPLSGHKSLPQYLIRHFSELTEQSYGLLGPGNTYEVVDGYDGVSVVPGTAKWMNVSDFIETYYLDPKKRSYYQKMHIQQLIRDHSVFTIANTLPQDIVEKLRLYEGRNDWEFMTDAVTPTTSYSNDPLHTWIPSTLSVPYPATTVSTLC